MNGSIKSLSVMVKIPSVRRVVWLQQHQMWEFKHFNMNFKIQFQVFWLAPGILRNDYPSSEAPLTPQVQDWKIIWTKEDWMFVVWCGYNPMVKYNGAFLLSRYFIHIHTCMKLYHCFSGTQVTVHSQPILSLR